MKKLFPKILQKEIWKFAWLKVISGLSVALSEGQAGILKKISGYKYMSLTEKMTIFMSLWSFLPKLLTLLFLYNLASLVFSLVVKS